MDKSRQRLVTTLLGLIAICVGNVLLIAEPTDAIHRLFAILFAVLAFGFVILVGFMVKAKD